MAKSWDEVRSDLKLFFRFATEKQVVPANDLVSATSRLFCKCPAARPAVLSLYGEIFEEYCLHFVQTSAGNGSATRLGVYLSLITSSSAIPAKMEVTGMRRSLSDRRPSEGMEQEENETPASPPPLTADPTDDSDEVDQFQSVRSFIHSLTQSIISLIESSNATVGKIIADWGLEHLCQMASHFQPLRERLSVRSGGESSGTQVTESIKEKIDYWRSCPVIDVLIQLMLKSMERQIFELKDVLLRLMNFRPESGSPPQTEWICCAVITSAQEVADIASCIQFLLNSRVTESVKEAIFSFLSSQNPESVISCSKSNIPFLLRLCSKSKALLHVLSEQITRSPVDIQQMNQMTTLTITENPDLRRDMIACLLSSDNSFELLTTLCDISVHVDANERLTRQALALLDSLVEEVHTSVYSGSGSKIPVFLDQLKLNYDQVVLNLRSGCNRRLRQVHLNLIKILAVHFGLEFAVTLLHEVFDKLSPVTPFDVYSLSSSRPNSDLTSFFDCLRLTFGRQMKDVCNRLLIIDKWKSDTFWINFLSLVQTNSHVFELDTEPVSEHLTDLLQMDMYDLHMNEGNKMDALIIVLEIIRISMEGNVSHLEKHSHSLCLSLVICYMNLVERLERISDSSEEYDDQTEKLMVAVCTSQKIMNILSKGSSGSVAGQQMLTRTFMDCILSWDQDLGPEKRRTSEPVDTCLKQENMSYGGSAHKFRKIPLNPGKELFKWTNQRTQQPLLSRPFARQLLLQGLTSCIRDMELFSHLLVESITPDVMFNDMTWPDEDFLKVTIERDLLIFKKYEDHCILWDLTQLIADHGLLRNCSVLIRALLAVQLTYWASGTSSEVPEPQSLEATQRLILLLSKSQLIPETPFKFIPEVLPHLNSWDIFCVCNDLWKLIRDTAMNQNPATNLKPYLERLRVIMGHKCPGQTFVKIFRSESGTSA